MSRACEFHTTDGILRYAIRCPGCKSTHVFTVGFVNEEGRKAYIKSREKLEAPYQRCPTWTFNGNLERPTFNPSYLVWWTERGQKHQCHSFVRDGRIQFLNDCTHDLKGKTVDLPEAKW